MAEATVSELVVKMTADVSQMRTELQKSVELLNKVAGASDRTAASSQTLERGWSLLTRTFAGFLSVGAVVSLLKRADAAFLDATRSSARLESTLKSTGYAAGLTSAELHKLVAETSRITGINDEPIRDAISSMLVYKNVSGDTFKQLLTLSADVAAQTGQDIGGVASALARAFDAPARSAQALRVAKINLSDSDQRLIKNFHAVGNLAGEQDVLMKRLKETYAGVAAALNQGPVKASNDLTIAWDRMLEALGKAPPTSAVKNFLSDWLNDITKFINDPSVVAFVKMIGLGDLEKTRSLYGETQKRAPLFSKGFNVEKALGVESAEERAARGAREQAEEAAREAGAELEKQTRSARLSAKMSGFDDELKLLQEHNAKVLAELEQANSDELLSLNDYYTKKEALTIKSINNEIDAIDKKVAALRSSRVEEPEERIARQAEINALLAERAVKTKEAEKATVESAAASSSAYRALGGQIAQLDAQYLSLNNRTAEAAALTFDLTNQTLRNTLEAEKNEEALKQLAALRARAIEDAATDTESGLRRAYRRAIEESQNAAKKVEAAWTQASQNIQRVLSNFLFDPFEKGLKGMVVDLANALRRMVADAAAADIMGAISGTGGGNLSALFAGIGGLFGFADGGAHPGGLRMVGERGPELEVTGPSRIFNAAQTKDLMSGGKGGDTIVVNMNISTGVAQTVRAEMASLMPTIEGRIKSSVMNAKLRGGAFGAAFS